MTDDPIVAPIRRFITTGDPVALLDRRTDLSDGVRPNSVPGYSAGVAALAQLRRVVTIALMVIAGVLVAPRFAAAGADPADLIRILGNQGLEVIRSRATLDQKATYVYQVLRQDFHLTDISALFLVRIGEARASRNGGSSAASSKTILCSPPVDLEDGSKVQVRSTPTAKAAS
jgi:hypothetical protein